MLEDAHLNRRYLPALWCADVIPQAIRDSALQPDPRIHQTVAEAVKKTLCLAETYYASGLQGLAYLPLRNDAAIAVAACVYRAIGRRLKARKYAWWQDRQVVGVGGKIICSLASLPHLAGRNQMRPKHDRHLHRALKGFDSVTALH